jgi:hypothetical protein
MPRYNFEMTLGAYVSIDMEGADEDEARTKAHDEVDEYLATINGNGRNLTAVIDSDGIGFEKTRRLSR